MTVRYRLDRAHDTNQTNDSQSAGLIAPERHADITRLNQDVAILHNLVLGCARLNELKFQGARRRERIGREPILSRLPVREPARRPARKIAHRADGDIRDTDGRC